MNIDEWGKPVIKDNKVKIFIKEHKNSLLKINDSIDKNEIIEVYNAIIKNKNLSNRAKLFYLDSLEDLLISSKISTTKGLIGYKKSLPSCK